MSLQSVFSDLLTDVEQPALNAAETFAKQFGGDALQIVTDQIGKYATGKEAFAAASSELLSRVLAAGWTDATAGINLLIEQAVTASRLKAGQAIATPPA